MLRWLSLLLACALPVMVVGQEVVCTPFDNNGDNIVGIGDLIDLLARFGEVQYRSFGGRGRDCRPYKSFIADACR